MKAALPLLVSLGGVAVAGIGLLGLAAPAALARLLRRWRVLTRLPVTLTLRIVFGSIFLVAAPDCRLPTCVRLVGLLEFAGAAVLLASGPRRLERFGDWWLDRSTHFRRFWCLGAFSLGIALFYAGA